MRSRGKGLANERAIQVNAKKRRANISGAPNFNAASARKGR